jgi:hypothetical protein
MATEVQAFDLLWRSHPRELAARIHKESQKERRNILRPLCFIAAEIFPQQILLQTNQAWKSGGSLSIDHQSYEIGYVAELRIMSRSGANQDS